MPGIEDNASDPEEVKWARDMRGCINAEEDWRLRQIEKLKEERDSYKDFLKIIYRVLHDDYKPIESKLSIIHVRD